MNNLRFVFLGLTITSSWGNGHAKTYRALLRQLAERGHEITFLERDLPCYAAHRDLAAPSYAKTVLYRSFEELADLHQQTVRDADLVVVGSFVPEGARVGAWVQELARGRAAFYDIDTPITLAKLAEGDLDYLTAEQISKYALYLSGTGGPTLSILRERYGAPCARSLYCSAAPERYSPFRVEPSFDLGFLGTYSSDRQDGLERLLLSAARRSPDRRFAVAGTHYPESLVWPENVERTAHLDPCEHPRFYASQRFTLNVTRQALVDAGWSPGARLFEAAACGTPVISDLWPGLAEIFEPGREILIARSTDDVLRYLRDTSEDQRRAMGALARRRFLDEHTSMHRAEALERITREVLDQQSRRLRIVVPPRAQPGAAQ